MFHLPTGGPFTGWIHLPSYWLARISTSPYSIPDIYINFSDLIKELHGKISARTFRMFIRVYPLLKIERLSAYIKLTLNKALIRSITT